MEYIDQKVGEIKLIFEQILEEMMDEYFHEPVFEEDGRQRTSLDKEAELFNFELVEYKKSGDMEFIVTDKNYNVIYSNIFSTVDI